MSLSRGRLRRRLEDPKVQRLLSLPAFAGCPAGEIADLCTFAEMETIPGGRVLLRRGRPARFHHLIIDGGVVVSDESTVRSYGPDTWWPAPIQRPMAPSEYTVMTSGPTMVLFIGPKHVPSLPDELPAVAAAIDRACARDLGSRRLAG